MYVALGTKTELIEDILMAAVHQCFIDKLPASRQQFSDALEGNRNHFVDRANQLAELVYRILSLRQEVRAALGDSHLADPHQQDIEVQLEGLIYPGFIRDIATTQLARLPAYLQGILKRLSSDKSPAQRTENQLESIQHYQQQYLKFYEVADYDYKKLDELRWMIEEFRIACFAQPMKTRMPVSEKKIEKLTAAIQSNRLTKR